MIKKELCIEPMKLCKLIVSMELETDHPTNALFPDVI